MSVNKPKKKRCRGSYVKHNEEGYYCIGCFNSTGKKYYLKLLKDNTGKGWRCPRCDFIVIDWVFERHWKEHLAKLREEKEMI